MSNVSSNSEAKRSFFRHDPVTSILLAVGIYLVTQIVAGVLVALYPAMKGWTETESFAWLEKSIGAQFVYILLAESFAIWLVFWFLKRAKVARSKIGLIRPVLKDVGRALLGYVVYFFAYILVITIAGQFTDFIDVEQPQQIGFGAASTPLELLLTFTALVVLPPLAEEIMFRGFLFSSFRARYKFLQAAVITSLLFGIVHLQFGSGAPLLWVAALDTFILSLVLCYLREKSGSLWPAIFLHALKNGVAFVVLVSQGKL